MSAPTTTRLLLALTLLTGSAFGQLWTGVLDPARAIDWSAAGTSLINESRPCNVTLAAGSSAATIQSAINAAPAHTAVCLSAGTYNSAGGIKWSTNFVTLRGAGANQTLFTNAGGGAGFYNAVMELGYSNITISSPDNVCTWSGTGGSAGIYTRGATSIDIGACSVGALSNLRVGRILVMDQNADGVDNGQIWNCAATNVCAYNGDGGLFRGGRIQEQTVTVVTCDGNSTRGHVCSSGAGVVISSPIHMPNWRSSQTPQVWFANGTQTGNGVENLSVDTGGSSDTHIMSLIGCDQCWVSGTRLINPNRAHVALWITTNAVVRDNYLYQNQTHNTVSYGIELAAADQNLVVNNIVQQSSDSSPSCAGGCEANVIAYNYAIYTYYAINNWMMASFVQHAAGDAYNLWEGNVGDQYQSDDIHGTHHFNTLYRNYISGYQSLCWGSGGAGTGACTGNVQAMSLMAASRYFNLVGNVIGRGGFQTSYGQIFDLGRVSGYTATGFCTNPPTCSTFGSNDPSTALTLMRWGNYDTVNNTVRWLAGENGSGAAGYPALTNPTQSIPASLFYSSKPSWFGSTAWPPLGPDVSGGNISAGSGAAAGLGGHANMIPAMSCAITTMGMPADGSGNVLTFNPSACYAASVGGPQPPTNLTVIVN